MMSNTDWDTLTDHWGSLADKWGQKLAKAVRQRKWKEIKQRFGTELGLSDEELVDFGRWLRDEWLPQQEKEAQAQAAEVPTPWPFPSKTETAPEPPNAESEPAVPNLHWREHDRTYWYDKSRDLYVVHLPSRKFPLAIPGDKWCAIRDAYSNWSGTPASVNELSRKFGLARRTVLELLRCMGTTHDSAPWSDEELQHEEEDALVDDLLRRKEERVLVKAERDNWDRIKADASKWQNFERQILVKLTEAVSQPYRVPKLKMPEGDRKFVAVVGPSDFHWGKRSDFFENGEEDNRKLQRERLRISTQRVVKDVLRHGRPEKIIVPVGSDWFNVDTDKVTTTDLTPQDNDTNPAEMLATGCQLMVEFVDYLRQVGADSIDLILCSGNHDRMLGVALLLYLKAWYRNVPSVKVYYSAQPRQYLTFGSTLMQFAHGDLVSKANDLARLAAVEQPKQWGNADHRMSFTGHVHTNILDEVNGFSKFTWPSLSGRDRWHTRKGYVGNRKQLAAVLVDQDDGMFAVMYAEGE